MPSHHLRVMGFPSNSLVSLKGSLVSPQGAPSITREIRSEFRFFNENYTFGDFLIDLLTVLNELFTNASRSTPTKRAPSMTREIWSEFRFFNENDIFLYFLIDLLSVVNEFNLFSIGE